jgi:C4-dicarboxylate-specific signal transduction histidine kinase
MAIADIFRQTSKTDSAIYFYQLAYSLSKTTSLSIFTLDASAALKDIFKSINIDSAFKYQEVMLTQKDSLFGREKLNQLQNVTFAEQQRQEELQQEKSDAENRLKLNALLGSTFTLVVVAFLLYRNNRNKQKAKQHIEKAYDQLKATQSQLIQAAKMASLGELTAGIAHEIQNPLNFVNNFSEVNAELLRELQDAAAMGNLTEVQSLSKSIQENEDKVIHHGKRADGIVKSMMQHSRNSTGEKQPTDINALCDEYLRLAYHGFRAKDRALPVGQAGFNVRYETEFDQSLEKVNVVPQEIGRVILNLLNNAFQAVAGIENPQVIISTKKQENGVEIIVADNGPGIPDSIRDKIFQPFFTTRPAGQGTGLGLSLSYDIVKAHGGDLKVETRAGNGPEFTIHLPINNQ